MTFIFWEGNCMLFQIIVWNVYGVNPSKDIYIFEVSMVITLYTISVKWGHFYIFSPNLLQQYQQ